MKLPGQKEMKLYHLMHRTSLVNFSDKTLWKDREQVQSKTSCYKHWNTNYELQKTNLLIAEKKGLQAI